MTITTTVNYKGLDIEARVTEGHEGDSSIPNGVVECNSVEILKVTADGEEDIWDMLTEQAQENCTAAVLVSLK